MRSFLLNLSLRKTIAGALLIGMAAPFGVSAWITLSERRITLLERLHEDHVRIVEVLAFGMQTPLWEIRPETGKPLIEALMLDQRITSITVSSPLVADFLKAEAFQRGQGEIVTLESPVLHDDEEIGRVRVTMDTGQLEAELASQWKHILLIGMLQFATGIAVIFALLRYKVLDPLRRLVGQSEALAAGKLNESWEWRRGDEMGILGRSFEATRQSLRNLISDLEKRNQELGKREAELANQASILRTILDNMTDGITLVDKELRLIAWNDRFVDILAVPRDLLRPGIAIEKFVTAHLGRERPDPGDRDAILRSVLASFRPDQPYSIDFQIPGNRWIHARRRPMPGGGFVSTYTDVTEHKQMEQALRDSEQRFRIIAETHPVPSIIVSREDQRLLYASPGFADLCGATLEQLTDLPTEHFYADPADRGRLWARLDSSGFVESYEMQMRRPDGASIDVSVSARPVIYQSKQAVLASILDLTERKKVEAELARHREALHQNEKLSALGSLLAGVAHELNNPLSVVVGRTIMLEEQLHDSDLARSIAKVREAAERCAKIVKTFLAMARQQAPARIPVRLADVIAAALDLVGYGLQTDGVEVSLDLDPELPELSADPDQLTQVFINVFINAQHALAGHSEPRRLKVSAHCDDVADALRVRITDNGPGIPQDILPRIFDPFFTTKPTGEGTGIGLSVSRGIVQAHGGSISVELPPEGGTTFEIILPLAAPKTKTYLQTDKTKATASSRRTLIVDDEPEVAELLGDILTSEGHRVEIAASGHAALQRIGDQDFDLILCDLHMPDLDGPGLYAELRTHRPKLLERLIFVTGDTLSVATKRFLSEAARPVIEKPFAPDELKQLIGQTLNKIPSTT